MKLIDKDALVAEIERLQSFFVNERDDFEKGYHHSLRLFKSFLDTIEVKEVDLEEEVKCILNQYYYFPEEPIDIPTVIRVTAKHFFELGLKAQKGE